MKSYPITSMNGLYRILAICAAVLYIFSFSVSGLFHPIHHSENSVENSTQALSEHCHHLHNAISLENSCEHGAHFSPEHKHCDFCDVLHTKKELKAKKEVSNIQDVLINYSDFRLRSVWQSVHFSKVYLRGPPQVV